MTKRVRLLVATVPVAVALASCESGAADSGGTTDAGPSVVTALYPLAFVADRVGADDVALRNIAAPGVEPHDLELAPQQVGAIADAALIVHLDGFAPAVDEAVEQNAADNTLDVDTVITLKASPEDEPTDEESGEEHADHGDLDPHFWLDPQLLGELATGLADRLGELDPDNADAYAERAAMLVTELAELDTAFEAGLASCATRTIVTAHAAFGYLAERYGLEQFSVAGLAPDAEPSAARIAEVQAEVAAQGVTTVYFEPLTSSAVVDAIAGDLGLDTAELDPIESVDPDAGEDYLTVMASNLATLRDGQGCS